MDMRFDHEGMRCDLGDQPLLCNLRELRIGAWQTPLSEMTYIRVSLDLHFLEITTHQGSKRWYIPQEQWDTPSLHRLDAFLRRARESSMRDEGGPEEVPEDLRKLLDP